MAVPHAFRVPLKGGRPLKRWRYVGVFGDDVMACFGAVRIGLLPQAFWAVLDGHVRVAGVADLAVEPSGRAIEVTSAHGTQQIWTRKTPARVRGTLAGVPV